MGWPMGAARPVAVRSRRTPRGATLYARHGIGELWIVDLDANLLRMYQQPQGDAYVQSSETANPGTIAIAALPGVGVDLSGVLA